MDKSSTAVTRIDLDSFGLLQTTLICADCDSHAGLASALWVGVWLKNSKRLAGGAVTGVRGSFPDWLHPSQKPVSRTISTTLGTHRAGTSYNILSPRRAVVTGGWTVGGATVAFSSLRRASEVGSLHIMILEPVARCSSSAGLSGTTGDIGVPGYATFKKQSALQYWEAAHGC